MKKQFDVHSEAESLVKHYRDRHEQELNAYIESIAKFSDNYIEDFIKEYKNELSEEMKDALYSKFHSKYNRSDDSIHDYIDQFWTDYDNNDDFFDKLVTDISDTFSFIESEDTLKENIQKRANYLKGYVLPDIRQEMQFFPRYNNALNELEQFLDDIYMDKNPNQGMINI